jgi:hypothetical protein
VEHVCDGVPATLVHGDFRTRHACVRRGRDGLALFPINWETAGWGVPAADLTRLDLPAYTSVIHSCWWPDACLEQIEQLAVAGRIFSSLAAIASISEQLACEHRGSLTAPLARLRMYRQQLAGGIRRLGEIV